MTSSPSSSSSSSPSTATQIRALAERYHAGEIDGSTFIEEVLALDWAPPVIDAVERSGRAPTTG